MRHSVYLFGILMQMTFLLSLAKGHPREKRILGLFNVVTFDNVECDDRDGGGVCFAAGECSNMGGTVNGNCASSFGVCCVFRTSTCGSTVTRNVTLIQNPGFPTPTTMAQTCTFTIQRVDNNICQLRLDFERLSVAEPDDGICGKSGTGVATTGDKITVKGGTGFDPPGTGGLCGNNLDGQHMYVEFGTSNTIMWSAVIGSDATVSRAWSIKTSQIPCNSNFKAPMDCVQYFTGSTGTISSYNRAGMRAPAGSTYSNCIRREEGKCSIEYKSNFFMLGAFANANMPASQNAAIDCAAAGVTISNAVGANRNDFCKQIFNVGNSQTINGIIRSEATPFRLGFATVETALTNVLGFELQYTQLPC